MRSIIFTLILGVGVGAWAGPGHSHGGGHSHSHGSDSHSHGSMSLNADQAKEAAQNHMERLVRDKKIEQSWTAASFDKAEMKKFGNKTEWVVTFNNEKDVKGKRLYIFLKPSGEFVAANFTGR